MFASTRQEDVAIGFLCAATEQHALSHAGLLLVVLSLPLFWLLMFYVFTVWFKTEVRIES